MKTNTAHAQKAPDQNENFTLTETDGVAVLSFDRKGEKVNSLNSKLFPEFSALLDKIAGSETIKAVVLISGKKDSFVAGADITELQTATEEEVLELSRKGQELFARLESLPQPVVAAINGPCLGGGLELALACDYRIATSSSKTVLGFPEVMLGLLPGAGGTQRLPKLIGLDKALPLMLTGSQLKAERAQKMGLVDYVVFPDGLRLKALAVAKALAAKTLKTERKRPKTIVTMVTKTKAGQKFILQKALQQVQQKTRGLYPAPKGIIEVLEFSLDHSSAESYAKESEVFARLSATSESKSLISLYFGQNELKKNRYGEPKIKAQHLGVLGAGLMGAGISLVSLQKGFQVRLRDISQDQVALGKKYIWSFLSKRVQRKSLSKFAEQKLMSQLFTQTDLRHFESCDVVIEAVFEDLNLKHKVLKEVEANGSDRLIFASNTSALPIKDIAKASKRPERVIGMHYFSPVEKMPLLEIIVTEQTDPEVAAIAVDVGIRQGKTVIVVKDGPGFYTTRILAPFMDEAATLAMEGIDFHTLDSTMKDFGYPVGPIALIDEVGIDVAFHVSKGLGDALGQRVSSGDPKLLSELIASGAKGRKSGKGFYLYDAPKKTWLRSLFTQGKQGQGSSQGERGKKPINPKALELILKQGKRSSKPASREEMQNRMCLRMVNEAVYCLHEGILQRPVDGDIGAVFGLGFPPMLGGPFRYVDQMGVAKVLEELKRLQELFGPRFTPCPLLEEMAKNNTLFYP